MSKIEDMLMAFIFGSVLPILLFLAGWWGSISLVPENTIFIIALIGLTAGVVIDILFLQKWLRNIYNTNLRLLIIIYLFYSICTFGFFMGVPIFNIIPGIMAGIFIGRRLYLGKKSMNETKYYIKKTCIFTTAVIIAISAASAFLALKDPIDTAGNLEGMFNIKSFQINTEMIIGLIIIGGLVLAASQYWLTKISAIITFRHGERSAE